MPQIDKLLFLPQVFGSFVFIFFTFIFLIKFAGLLLASTYKVRNNLTFGAMSVNSIVKSIVTLHLTKYSKLVALSLKIKSLLFFCLFV